MEQLIQQLIQQLINRLVALESEFDSLPDLSIIQELIKEIEALKQNEAFTKETLTDAVTMYGNSYITTKSDELFTKLSETFNKLSDDNSSNTETKSNELNLRIDGLFQEFKTDLNKRFYKELLDFKQKADEHQLKIDDMVQNALLDIKLKLRDVKNGKDGVDGKDGANGIGIKGDRGDDGANGVGINDITYRSNTLIISLSDGSKKEIRLNIPSYSMGGGGGGGSSTYTNLNPVPKTVGGISAGTTFENMDITAVLDMLLYPFSASFSITPTTATMGQTVTTIDMTFSVSDSTATMEISNGVGDVTGTISYSLSGIFIADTSFTLTATKDSNTATINKSLIFLNYVYSGVTPNTAPIESEILASSKTLSNTKNKTVTYDCTGGNRFYIAYPQRMGTMSAVKVNGLPFNGYTVTTATITNEYSFSEVYTIYTSNNLVYGSAIPVIWS